MTVAMLNDLLKCTACKGCQIACKQWNDLPGEATRNTGSYQNPPDLSYSTLTYVKFHEANIGGQTRWLFQKFQCLHCSDAACVKVCPTQALKSNRMGIVTLEQDLCSGCGYCIRYCPFGIPKHSGSTLTGKGVVSKCTFCQDRTTSGGVPACAKTCPSGAISFGERDKMVALGQQRVEVAKSKGYPDAMLYGQRELNGLGMMYVLLGEPEVYGLPTNPTYNAGLVDAWQSLKPDWKYPVGAIVLGSFVHLIIGKVKDPALIADQEEEQ